MTNTIAKQSNSKSLVTSTATFASMTTVILSLVIESNAFASSDADYSFTIASDWQDCQQIGTDYQAVYAFETASFYVNICQKDDAYFYSGQAKQQDRNSIFIPAYPLENKAGFLAKNGNLSYLVLLPFSTQNNFNSSEPGEAILTIKRNDRLVSVESSLNKYCHRSETEVVWDTIELQPDNSDRVATIPQYYDVGAEFSTVEGSDRTLSTEIFNSESRFDFYRIGGKLHRLTTCD